MEDDFKIAPKRCNKFTGKEDISRQTTDNILTKQIDTLREISAQNAATAVRLREILERNDTSVTKIRENIDVAVAKIRETINTLHERKISINTAQFEHLSRHFITQMEDKLRRTQRPAKGLKWYIAMWLITLIFAFLTAHFMHKTRQWKQNATYWHQQYEAAKAIQEPAKAQ